VVRGQESPNLSKKPGTRIGPPAVGGGDRNTEHSSGFRRGQTSEVTQLNQFSLLAILRSELLKRVIESEQVVILLEVWYFDLLDVEPLLAASVPQGALPSRGVNQNAPHRFSRCAEEMRAILPRLLT
jgi:hypothetical protein